MSTTRIEISCPHCMRMYRLRVDLRTLAGSRSTARCGRCGRRFSLSKRVHDSGVMTSPVMPAAREVPASPHARNDPRSLRDTDPTGIPEALREGRVTPTEPPKEAAHLRRMARTPREGRGAPAEPSALARNSPPSAWAVASDAAVEPGRAGPDYASEPPRDSQPLVALRRRTTRPMLPGRVIAATVADEIDARAASSPVAVEASPTAAGPVERGPTDARPIEARPIEARPIEGRATQPSMGAQPAPGSSASTGTSPDAARARTVRTTPPFAAATDPLEALGRMPVGGDLTGFTPLDGPFDEATPSLEGEAEARWVLDGEAWIARADPGLDALSAAHSEAAAALRWLLCDDGPAR